MIFIFGPAGSGKSTQTKLLADALGREWRSVGELCREQFADYTRDGSMVPEAELAAAIKQEIDAVRATGKDLVFDGQPWSSAGAEIMLRTGIFDNVESIVLLDVPRDELLSRLAVRGRADDRPEVWEKKIDMYDSRIADFLAPLRAAGIPIISVSGLGTPTEVSARLLATLGL
ncbi:nucleoside monophosphate kinase [Candidatus Saccharibacteria bacterium]|nr:nucleoside monophosphate kinase [Candidatus Saccharibacteria bacterium]